MVRKQLVEDTETEDSVEEAKKFSNDKNKSSKKKIGSEEEGGKGIHKTKHNEETVEEDSAGAATLHAGGGSGGGIQDASRSATVASIMHHLATVNHDTLKYFNDMMAKHDRKAGELGIKGQATAPTTHPSAAVAKEALDADVEEMLGEDENLTAEFKEKAKVLFEAAVNARVNTHLVSLEEAYEQALDEELEEITKALEDKVATYCEYVGEEWMKENEVAIESALRNEITSEFMNKLRELFIESNINIPEEQVEVVDTLATKVEELESRLGEAITENAELRQFKVDAEKKQHIEDQADELKTVADKEKFKKLAEGVDTDDMGEFTEKVKIIKESITTPAKKKSTVENLMEEVDETKQPEEHVTGAMKRYLDVFGSSEEV